MAAVPPKSGAAGGFAGYQKFWHDKRIFFAFHMGRFSAA